MVERRMIPADKPETDPSHLTTQALRHEIGSIKELFDTRFDGLDSTVERMLVLIDRLSAVMDEKVNQLRNLTDEKFAGVGSRFAEARYLTEQTSRNDKIALDAALQAQKEDVGKQNDSNNASISKTEILFTKQIDALDDKIDDIKSRFIAGDSQMKGKTEGIGAAGALIIGGSFVISAGISIITFVINHAH